MTITELLARLNDRIEAAVFRHVHRHPTMWIIATSVLVVVVALLAWRAA